MPLSNNTARRRVTAWPSRFRAAAHRLAHSGCSLSQCLLAGVALFGSGIVAAALTAPAQAAAAQDGDTDSTSEPTETAESATERLNALMADEWNRTMKENPTWASSLGDLRFNESWPDLSQAALDHSHRLNIAVLEKLDAIPVDELAGQDRVNYKLFRRQYEESVKRYPYQWYLIPLNQRGGIQDEASLADSLTFDAREDFDDWIARMEAFPEYMQQTMALMREGMDSGIMPPRIVMERISDQIAAQIVDDPTRQMFYKPFLKLPDEFSDGEKERLTRTAFAAVESSILPAYREFQEFFNQEYLPACLDQVGIWQLPRGDELYSQFCEEFTTTTLTPEEIHRIGLSEVARIRKEMEEIIEEVGFEGSFAEFLEDLRTNPKFYFDNKEDLLLAYLAICKEVDPQLVKLFEKLPRIPYGVEAIPDYMAPDTTTAYYRPPAADGSRAGTYFVNLYRPDVRPKYEMEALSLHESVPGHHLQIALAQELDNLPPFRRYGGYTAFVEGWGLYAESLGSELGMYQDPYSHFGQLTYEMWRAVRLVVDTGMHYHHWTRQQAIDFFAENTAKTMLDIENEVDRYIAWPGQALAYKIGELKIQELKRLAMEELGEEFDIRKFHTAVLKNGAVTLDVLENQVQDWIAAEKASGMKKR